VNWVDLILLCLFALFGLRGFFRGFFREVFSLVALVIGFMVAVAYDQDIATFVARHWQVSPLLLKGLSFVAIFFIVYFLINLAGWLLHRSEKLLFLKTLNRTGGVAVGLGKGAALAALAIFLLTSTALLPQPTRANFDNSYLAGPLTRLGQDLVRFGKERVFAGDGLQPAASPGSTRL
jgi:membrane protein required for colicin V production